MSSSRRLPLFVAGLALVAWPSAGRAQDQKKKPASRPIAKAMADLDHALKAGVHKHIVRCIDDLARAARGLQDVKRRNAVRRKLKRCLRHSVPEVCQATLRAYGVLALPGSAHDLRGFVDPRKTDAHPPDTVAAAIEAWGRIHDPDTHDILLDRIKVPSRHKTSRDLAKHAVHALAGYAELKGHRRYVLLRDFMQVFELLRSAAGGAFMASAAATEWWRVLHLEMVATFNKLTRQKCESHDDCRGWWRANHRRVKAGKA